MNNLEASLEILKLVISKENFDNLSMDDKKNKIMELFFEIYIAISKLESENKPPEVDTKRRLYFTANSETNPGGGGGESQVNSQKFPFEVPKGNPGGGGPEGIKGFVIEVLY